MQHKKLTIRHSKETIEQAKTLYMRGEPNTSIAKRLKVSHTSIERWRDKQGWETQRQELRDQALDEAQYYTLRRFNDLGLTPEEVMRRVAKMVRADEDNVANQGIERYLDMTGQKPRQGTGGNNTLVTGPVIVLPDNGRCG